MTRETRIGLLVGLVFIVLFGVVLSELGTSEEPLTAQRPAGDGFYLEAPVLPQPAPEPERTTPLAARSSDRSTQPPQPQRPPQRPRQADRSAEPRERARGGGRTVVRRTEDGRTVEMTPEQVAEFARRNGMTLADARPTPPPPAPRQRKHMTRRGDSLTAIVRKYYRTASRVAVMKVFNANRSVLRNPDSVPIGVELVIP